jgi:glycosyltransferase involved in cell wall biosynthesis
MRIAQIAPLYESVPPQMYGGTERVVSYLTEELVNQGHRVTLFASGDSQTRAQLVPVCERSLRLHNGCHNPDNLHLLQLEEVVRRQHDFDIIHSHIDALGFTLGRRLDRPVISTMHGRLDLWEHPFVFQEYREALLVSISRAQRLPLPGANWLANVYHGLPEDLYTCQPKSGDYLVFLGRISPEKKVDSAIRIAVLAGIPLKIAAKIARAELGYYETVIRPLFAHPLVEFLGEVNDREKRELLQGALAFLHPVDWPEPFGLAMLEAMACGTPVIARRRGSIPEVVDHGITGFIFEEDEEAAVLLRTSLPFLSRRRCRQQFEKRFLAKQMTETYLEAYHAVLADRAGRLPSSPRGENRCMSSLG